MDGTREISRISVGSIEIPDGRRAIVADKVAELASSMSASVLLNPIWVSCVRGADGYPVGYRLIAGNHRIEAAKKLGWEYIDARIVDCSDTEARLMEIAENLHRAELTVGERADQIAEWVRLTAPSVGQLDPHPTNERGNSGREGGFRAAARQLPVSGETEEARRNTVRRAVRIAGIAPEAREAARAAGLDDNQAVLLRIASAAPEAQVEAVAAIVEAKAEKRAAPKLTRDDVDRIRFAYFNRANDAARFAFWPEDAPKTKRYWIRRKRWSSFGPNFVRSLPQA
jgi:ParB-like chromosome segregation protein Spo0J